MMNLVDKPVNAWMMKKPRRTTTKKNSLKQSFETFLLTTKLWVVRLNQYRPQQGFQETLQMNLKKYVFLMKLTLDDILFHGIERGVFTVYFAGNGNTGMSLRFQVAE